MANNVEGSKKYKYIWEAALVFSLSYSLIVNEITFLRAKSNPIKR